MEVTRGTSGEVRGLSAVPAGRIAQSCEPQGLGAPNLDYTSCDARLASILYQMTGHLGLATGTMRDELHSSWLYLSRFAGAHPMGLWRPAT